MTCSTLYATALGLGLSMAAACGSTPSTPSTTSTTSTTSSGDQGDPCDTCESTEYCNRCNTAGPAYAECKPNDTPTAAEFACQWLACAVGDVCIDSEPAGDGCPDAKCVAVPSDCSADPTCACLEEALGGFECTTDTDGNVTVRGYSI